MTLDEKLSDLANRWNHPTSLVQLHELQKQSVRAAFDELKRRLGPEPNVAKPMMDQIVEELL
jgi:hypothetical protein